MCGGISPEGPKMYICSYKVAHFSGSGVQIWLDVCGSISPERQKMYILSYKLALFSGSGVKIRFYLRDGNLPEKKILSYKLELFSGKKNGNLALSIW